MSARALIITSFGAETTADDVIAGIDLTGQRAIVTGGSSGLGLETARALASAGAEVTLAVRDTVAGERSAADITAATRNRSMRVARLDLADPASVTGFVEGWDGPLHMLVNNAAVMALPGRTLTPQGWEMQLATNHLGHFALACGLRDALAASGEGRVVSLTSRGHFRSPVIFDDLHFEQRPYEPFVAYGQSKTANILFAVEATRRWESDGITANAVFPGIVLETGLARHVDAEVLREKAQSSPIPLKTIPQGAATPVLVAAARQLEGVGGRYFEDCNEAPVVEQISPETPRGVAAYAIDPANAERLWEVSERHVG